MTTASRTTARRVLAQTRFETIAVLRNGEQLLLTVVLPVLALVALTRTSLVPLPEPRADAALAGAVALAVASTAFTGQAIAVAFDRRWGVLRMLSTTPLGPTGLLGGKLGAVLAVIAVQVALLVGVAAALGWRPDGVGPAQLLAAVVLVVLGAAAFVSFALLLGGTLRPEGVLAIANLVWVLMAVGGGLVLPLGVLPAPLDTVMSLTPPGALGEGLRTLATTGLVDVPAVVALLVWTAIGSWLAGRYFRWDA
ncbi:ABC transporter permease [Georgenia faecalis]|uniref:ABC transporter permease n=1 Tax=Georgenia faecalis TaxID=2483799 RepID=A0ABV9DCF6_9MICO|nr:ABC transporter permease [Georgenia faecalis]